MTIGTTLYNHDLNDCDTYLNGQLFTGEMYLDNTNIVILTMDNNVITTYYSSGDMIEYVYPEDTSTIKMEQHLNDLLDTMDKTIKNF